MLRNKFIAYRHAFTCAICTLGLVGLFSGCAVFPGGSTQAVKPDPSEWPAPSPGRIIVLFARHANYAGEGRIHILKVDDHAVGELTGNNYFQLELWPGNYQFTVCLPSENFFGKISPPASSSSLVHFAASDAGSVFGLQYTDGRGGRSFQRRRWKQRPAFIRHRVLSGKLSARQTAQVTRYLDARYDGPALNGKPHGQGTLTWPDGAVFEGKFEYGRATNKARFLFPDGSIFMGLFQRARPKSPGVLMAPDGRITFAGDFIDEKPDGVGMRIEKEAPEFCIFDQGRDITKSYRQLAREILDTGDQDRIEKFSQKGDHLDARIEAARNRLMELKADSGVPKSVRADQSAELYGTIHELERERSQIMATAGSDLKKFIEEIRATRWERELVKVMELKEDHQAEIEKERIWCREEFALNRRPCRCAPLADDFTAWDECQAQVEKRYDPIKALNPDN